MRSWSIRTRVALSATALQLLRTRSVRLDVILEQQPPPLGHYRTISRVRLVNQLGFCSFSFEPSKQYVLVGQAQDEDGPVAALKFLPQSTTCCTFTMQQVSGICYRRIDALRMSHLM